MSNNMKIYLQPSFLICTIILAIAGSSMSFAIKKFGIVFVKELLPIKKSLDNLDEKKLTPYKVMAKEKIEDEEIIKVLGTNDYIQWVIEDMDVPADSAVRKCVLFVTYYGLPDRVPHVPEECYTGSGHQQLTSENETFEVNNEGNKVKIPVRSLVFGKINSNYWQSSTKFSISYFFKVNGDYTNSREDTRFALNKNISGKHSYFSKVEWKFFNNSGFGGEAYPTKDEAIKASQKLLTIIVPVLEKEHWPDWEK